MQLLLTSLLLFTLAGAGKCDNLRSRTLQSAPYFETSDAALLGAFDRNAAMGNPLKGLLGGSRWSHGPLPEAVPLSMEWANFGLDEIMTNDNTFDWTLLDSYIEGSASRNRHFIFSVFIHWPGKPLRLPPHLLDIDIRPTNAEKGPSPYYGDERLLAALRQFIFALGERYDGDKRIATIHLGLLGFCKWISKRQSVKTCVVTCSLLFISIISIVTTGGEFHTFPFEYVPESSKAAVVAWYSEAFSKTQLQARYPRVDTKSMGLYDGSFAYNTLDGQPNGGVEKSWYFWPKIKKEGQENSWRTNMMGGETRPEIQKQIFTDEYPAGTENHQDFKLAAETTHMSFILHHDAFQNGGYKNAQLKRALDAHTFLGYNFYLSHVAAAVSTQGNKKIDLTVTIVNEGIAPFYYDCGVQLDCEGLSVPLKAGGVEKLVGQGESGEFVLSGVPASRKCLEGITLALTSSYAFEGNPIKFAQGNGRVILKLPGPDVDDTSSNGDGRSGSNNDGADEDPVASPSFWVAIINAIIAFLFGEGNR